jgi:uncharacterized protein (TIGR02271 family)
MKTAQPGGQTQKDKNERMVMTVFDKFSKVKLTAVVASTAMLAAGCHCNSGHSGGSSYAYTPAPYSSYSSSSAGTYTGAAETSTEMQAGTNMVIPLFQESLAVGTRQVEQGTVRLKKVVKTETVNQPVQLRRETVVIERQPASNEAGAAPENAFQEKETVIQLWREEPVIETRIVPAGQIVAQRKSEVEQTTVQRQVRKEDVDIDKSGDAQNVTISGDLSSTSSAEAAGGTADTSGQAYGKSAGGPITSISTLTSASDPTSYSQRSVKLENLKVEKVIGDRLVEVHDDGGRPLFIRLNETMPNVREGDMLNVTGTCKTIPSGMTDLGLGSDAQSALHGQQIFVDAQKYEATNH